MHANKENEELQQLKAAYAQLYILRPKFIEDVKAAKIEEIGYGFAFGRWMNGPQKHINNLLNIIELCEGRSDANGWLENVLTESGRFKRVNPRGYMTFVR